MHDQSASRTSGRTLAAVAAMSVRALRIMVLKSAGSFTRDEQYDPGAGKFPARHMLYVQEVRTLLRYRQFSNAGAAGRVLKFQVVVHRRDGPHGEARPALNLERLHDEGEFADQRVSTECPASRRSGRPRPASASSREFESFYGAADGFSARLVGEMHRALRAPSKLTPPRIPSRGGVFVYSRARCTGSWLVGCLGVAKSAVEKAYQGFPGPSETKIPPLFGPQ